MSNNSRRTLSEAQEIALYFDVQAGVLNKTEIGRKYGVSPRTVGRVAERVERNLHADEDYDDTDLGEYTHYEDGDQEYGEGIDDDDENDDDERDSLTTIEYNFIVSNDSISITENEVDSDGDTVATEQHSITRGDSRFDHVYDMILRSRGSQETLAEAFVMINTKRYVESVTHGRVRVEPDTGRAFYVNTQGREVDFPGDLKDRLVDSVRSASDDLNNLLAFADKLQENPSYKAVQGLYRFLKAKNIEIVAGGYVECWKTIRGDYTDCYTGTFDNSVGATVKVDRNEVDEDPDRTCSRGLHVCAHSYLVDGPIRGERVIKCLVHPADFVAVPKDYNDAKARVCKYLVASEVTDTWRNAV